MLEFLGKVHQSLKDFMVNFVLRKILIPTLLTLMYFLVIGLFSILAKIFSRKMLNPSSLKDSSFWVTTSGNEPEPEKLLRQS